MFHIPSCLGSLGTSLLPVRSGDSSKFLLAELSPFFLSKPRELPASPNACVLLKARSRAHEVLALSMHLCLSVEMAVSQWHFGSPEECHLLSFGILSSSMHG